MQRSFSARNSDTGPAAMYTDSFHIPLTGAGHFPEGRRAATAGGLPPSRECRPRASAAQSCQSLLAYG